jgi:hypothetical protein
VCQLFQGNAPFLRHEVPCQQKRIRYADRQIKFSHPSPIRLKRQRNISRGNKRLFKAKIQVKIDNAA